MASTPQTKDSPVEEKPRDRNPNYIRDLIFTSLSLTEKTKVPILYMGNPGIAKTTGVRTWAKMNNYKVTTLIGTQRVAEEILGYMVNDVGERKLITYTPDWYDEIIENQKAGFKTLLFVDELSQAPDNVQGAMLQLIFDRRVGGRANYLPEDTLVVSAANYKGNIPPQCGIQAPTLNRFCIINIEPEDGIGLVTEFLQTEEEKMMKIPAFTMVEVSDAIRDSIRYHLKMALNNIVAHFSKNEQENNEIVLDFTNQNFNEMFDRPGPIYNFISGRTISYLQRMFEGMIHLGIVRKEFKTIVTQVFYGLAGLGTNNFKDDPKNIEGDFSRYLVALNSRLQTALRKSVEANLNEINSTELNYTGKTIDTCISDWLRYSDSTGSAIYDKNLTRLMTEINNQYPTSADEMCATLQKWNNKKMLNDLQKITTLHNHLKAYGLVEVESLVKNLAIIKEAYDGYLGLARGEMVN